MKHLETDSSAYARALAAARIFDNANADRLKENHGCHLKGFLGKLQFVVYLSHPAPVEPSLRCDQGCHFSFPRVSFK